MIFGKAAASPPSELPSQIRQGSPFALSCQCGYSFVVLSVASFEPVYAEDGELFELSPRSDLSLAA
jgi:hypothetical protein